MDDRHHPAAPSSEVARSDRVRGRVLSPDGSPVPEVLVSNGSVLVPTDEAGRFELSAAGPYVFLIRPSGFDTNRWYLPSTTSEELTFTLAPARQDLPYTFTHLTDVHLRRDPIPSSDAMRRQLTTKAQLVEYFRNFSAISPTSSALVITGDLVETGTEEEYDDFCEAIAQLAVPSYLAAGNHDHVVDSKVANDVITASNYYTNSGSPERYERRIGPRWYSFDIAGLHCVVMDWHSYELGLDDADQRAWIANDLRELPEGRPWILFIHDHPSSQFLADLPSQPLATFSGHWHVSRLVHIGDTLHVSTSSAFFGGLDYSPPGFRDVTWDGQSLLLRDRMLPSQLLTGATPSPRRRRGMDPGPPTLPTSTRWQHQLSGPTHRAEGTIARVDGEDVVAWGVDSRHTPAGGVEVLRVESGELLWRRTTPSAVKTTPLVARHQGRELLVVAEVSGDVVAHEAATGEIAWRNPSADPTRTFAWESPAYADGIVVAGGRSDFRAIDVGTGATIWRRTDLSPHNNVVSHGKPLIVGRTVVVGFWPSPMWPIALDLHTGEAVWELPPAVLSREATSVDPIFVTGSAAFDGRMNAVVVPGLAKTVSIDLPSGRLRWVSSHRGGLSPSEPVITPQGYVATLSGLGLALLDPQTGETRWALDIDGGAGLPMGAYRQDEHPVLASPLVSGDGDLLLPCLDGSIRRISLDGHEVARYAVGHPLAAQLLSVDDGVSVIATGTDGWVSRRDLRTG